MKNDMDNCIFCKIIKGEIPCSKVYEDDDMIVFNDIEPKAKVHMLCVPKSHFKLLADADEAQMATVAKCLKKIPEIAQKAGLENGYRIIINQGDDAGQTVFHLHIHVLGGEKLKDF